MKKPLVLAVVPFLALGCGEELKDANGDGVADGVREPDSVTVVTPSTPVGTVSGQVLGTDLKALTDVSVEMTIGSSAEPKTATTDAKGNFEFTDVPAGAQVLLTFSKTGYATLRASSTVPSSAGNVPINNGNASFGPVTLARLDGSLRFLLVTPQGRPAANVRATLEATPAGNIILFNYDNSTRVVSNVVVEATSNDQGALVFEGIPSATELARLNNDSGAGHYRLWVSATDANSDGVPEAGGFVGLYQASEVVANSTPRIINLPYSKPTGAALAVENTNVASLRGDTDPLRNMVRPGEPIYVFFNQPVQQSSLLVRLTDEYAKETLSVTATVTNGGYSATINPGPGVVQDGREYNMDLRAVSAEGGSVLSKPAVFFGGDAAAGAKTVAISEARYQETSTVAPASFQLNPGEEVFVHFNYPLAATYNAAPGSRVYAHLNTDIGGPVSGIVGDFPGEVNNPQGFELEMVEPTAPIQTKTPAETPVFSILKSNYSTRWKFTYGGNTLPNFSNVQVVVSFSKLGTRSINGTYETIWGQPVTSDVAVNAIAQQPVPTP